MPFAQSSQIRSEAGFTTNQNITNAAVSDAQTRAYNTILTYLASRYNLTMLTSSLFSGSPAQVWLSQVEIMLAAGWMLLQEYQGQPMGEKNGQNKVDTAMKMLQDLQDGKIRLMDNTNTGTQFPANAPSALAGQPALTTPPMLNPNPTSSERKFSVDKIY